jgi:hypothetical protein
MLRDVIVPIIFGQEYKLWSLLCYFSSLLLVPFFWAQIFSAALDYETFSLDVIFQVLTAARIKFRVLWDVSPCIHVDTRR